MAGRKPITQKERKGYAGKNLSVFYENVRERRISLGLDQSTLAKKMALRQSQISAIEGGRFPNDPDRVALLADALDVDLNWLFGREWPKAKGR